MVTRGHTVPGCRGLYSVSGSFLGRPRGWSTMVGTGIKVVDRDENRAKSQNSTTLGFSGQHGRRGKLSGTPMMTRVWNGAERGPRATGSRTAVGWVPGLGEHPQSQNRARTRSRLVGLWSVGWADVVGSHGAGASVRGAASKLSSPSEPVSYGLVQFKCCIQCWLIIVYESRLLFVCLQYYV